MPEIHLIGYGQKTAQAIDIAIESLEKWLAIHAESLPAGIASSIADQAEFIGYPEVITMRMKTRQQEPYFFISSSNQEQIDTLVKWATECFGVPTVKGPLLQDFIEPPEGTVSPLAEILS